MEVSTWGMRKSAEHPHIGDPLNCVGMLERVTHEPVFTQEEWNDGGDGPDAPIPTETVYHLRTLDGRQFSWRNARMIRVPDTADFRIMNNRT